MNRRETYPGQEITSLRLGTTWGNLLLTSGDTTDIEVLISGDDEAASRFVTQQEKKRVTLTQQGLFRRRKARWAQAEVRVPKDWKGTLRISTRKGDLTLTDLSGSDVSIAGGKGETVLQRITALTLKVKSRGGKVQLRQASAPVMKLRLYRARLELEDMVLAKVTGLIRLPQPAQNASQKTNNAPNGEQLEEE